MISRIFMSFFFFFFSFLVSMGSRSTADSLLDLDSLRKSLVRQEDTIIFGLIERAKYPTNSRLYDDTQNKPLNDSSASSLFLVFVQESEAVHSKAGRYVSPEENPFFPDHLPSSLLLTQNQTAVLHPPGASININDQILNLYIKTIIPLFAEEGDDGNYAVTAATDLTCLQAISRRIHYGKFVAEVKFRNAPQEYAPAIQAQDREALMKLLTFESVEETVKQRVGKKAMIFGQDVELEENDNKVNTKIDPSAVSQLYGEWVIPLTKLVEVEYLLRRLDRG